MLFLGTKKYPKEEEYEGFLSQYGGFSNAYTDMEDTNYFFSLTTTNEDPYQTTEGLHGALDRLAQFFVAPTFDANAVDREISAIDSEYRNGRTSDSWRNYQLLKSVSNPQHPFSKFGCGNNETLKSQGSDILLRELQQFWQDYYQTYNLRLAVVGHANLDALQKTVEETFGALRYSEGAPRRVQSSPKPSLFTREHAVYGGHAAFGPPQLGILRQVLPLTEQRSLKVSFAVPPLDDPVLRESKPYRALSHVLGHESPGSLHALLNELGYITGLSSGVAIDTSDFALFAVTITLTPKGMKHYEHVLDLLFQWIALIKHNQGTLRDYHEELRQITDMNFRFRENGDPSDFCSSAAELLFDEIQDPSDHARILVRSSDTSEFDPLVMKAFLDRLTPENSMIHVTSSDWNATVDASWTTEGWYGAKYKVTDLTNEQMQGWLHPAETDDRLRLPALNQYIPTDFSLKCDKECYQTSKDESMDDAVYEDDKLTPPRMIMERPNIRVWHKMDTSWRVPKSYIRLALLSPEVYNSPRSMTLNRIFQRVLNDDLNSFVYDASVAGCSYRVSCAPNGYRITVRGYSEKLSFLLDTLTTRILSLIEEMKTGNPVLQERFNTAKESLLRETKNYRLDSPYEVANYNSRLLIEENVWYIDNYVDEMEGETSKRNPLTMEECARVVEQSLTGRIKAEVLCMGNIDEQDTMQVVDVVDRHFLQTSRVLSEAETPRFRSMKLPTREEAAMIFGPQVAQRSTPIVYQELAYTETEENNAVELILQAGSELSLGYEGLAILDLITHVGYNSAFNQLRTKEQVCSILEFHLMLM
jgi:insulysin